MKKRKKKKNKLLLFIFLILIIGGGYLYMNMNKTDDTVKKSNNDSITSDKDEQPTSTKADNYKSINYYLPANLDRYIAYKAKYNYSYEKTITYVNIGLDYNFYDPAIVKTISDDHNELVLINKYNKISDNFSPALVTLGKEYSNKTLQVTNNTKLAFEALCDKITSKNLSIKAVSAYRTYAYQQNLYNNYVTNDGKTNADTYSARPGYSEHHTGLAIDVQGGNVPYTQFDTTTEYTWLKDNAHLYGFIIRYPKGKENITGYMYEAWHIRYVGIDVATYIYNHNITFDEYYAQFLIK